jgi:tetratricopeptide (TPR) repeat protein
MRNFRKDDWSSINPNWGDPLETDRNKVIGKDIALNDKEVDHLLQQAQENVQVAVEIYLQIGEMACDMDQFDLCLYAYEAAIQVDPDCYPAHFALGLLMLDMDDPNAAQQHYERLLELDVDSAEELKRNMEEYLKEQE